VYLGLCRWVVDAKWSATRDLCGGVMLDITSMSIDDNTHIGLRRADIKCEFEGSRVTDLICHWAKQVVRRMVNSPHLSAGLHDGTNEATDRSAQ